MNIAEKITGKLNDIIEDQTEACGTSLRPLRFESCGNQWSVNFLGISVVTSEEDGSLNEEELMQAIRSMVKDYLESIRLISI